ncbi:MAG: chorismate mutase [Candidatus Kaiserbacteria bacterium]|nr:chorismate mutase [Candidatus Kaiserbacteria bacterium]
MKFGISGVEGSFSEKAAKGYIAQNNGLSAGSQLVYLVSAEGVLAALESGEVDIGVFPIENSGGGMVKEALEAMSKHNFKILEVASVAVHHCLIAMPGTDISEITTVTSHIQALTQCEMAIKRLLPKAQIEEYPDTAKAAEDLAQGTLPRTTAVIASIEAANRNSLEILHRNIEDRNFNVTNFIVAKRRK